jgi:hypothetical protein
MRRSSSTRPARLGLEALEAREVPAVNFLAFGAAPGGRPLVEVFRFGGTSLGQFEAFESSFRGGVRAAAADLDGNVNTLEVIAVPGPGGGPVVRVFQIDLVTLARTELVTFLAFNADFRGGLGVAAGNVAGPDARDEIIVAADSGGGPRVRVLSVVGNTVFTAPGPLGDFFALNVEFLGGVRVAAGELDGNLLDGDELVVAAGPTGGPRVQVFRSDGVVLADFFAFRPDFRGGVQASFQSNTVFEQLRLDALALDPSQRSVTLNDVALGIAPVTGGVVANVGGVTVGTTVGTTTFGTTGGFTTGTTGVVTPGFGTPGFGSTAGGFTTGSTTGIGTGGIGITIGGTTAGFGTPATFGTTAVVTRETAFTAFGDPGPLAPFPPLAFIPFAGPTINTFPTFFGPTVLL